MISKIHMLPKKRMDSSMSASRALMHARDQATEEGGEARLKASYERDAVRRQ